MNATLARSTAPVARDALVGIDQPVPLLDGRFVPYVNLDNAASTPAFRSVVDAIDEFLPFYSGVHRGTGYKSRLSTDDVRTGTRTRRRVPRRRPGARCRRVHQEHDRGDQQARPGVAGRRPMQWC